MMNREVLKYDGVISQTMKKHFMIVRRRPSITDVLTVGAINIPVYWLDHTYAHHLITQEGFMVLCLIIGIGGCLIDTGMLNGVSDSWFC